MSPPSLPCRSCSEGVPVSNRFCPACGELYPTMAATSTAEAPLRDLAAEIVPLVREKAQLGRRLERLATESARRELTPDERQQWELAYTRWRDVASEITLLVDHVHPRADTERRSDPAVPPPGAEPRSREDRRDPFWNRAP